MPQDYIDACGKDGQKIERLIRTLCRSQPRRGSFINGGAGAGMVAEDLKIARRHVLLKEHGLDNPIGFDGKTKKRTNGEPQ